MNVWYFIDFNIHLQIGKEYIKKRPVLLTFLATLVLNSIKNRETFLCQCSIANKKRRADWILNILF